MRKKFAREFILIIILLIVIVAGGIFWLKSKKQQVQNQYFAKQESASKLQTVNFSNAENSNQSSITCIPHYYQGEATVQGWPAQPVDLTAKTLTVQIENQDIEKLPTTKADSLQQKFTVLLIDPTEKNIADLENATEQNPASIIVHGYAQICQSSPQVSIQQATVAFRKS